jgi:hypothetical protein
MPKGWAAVRQRMEGDDEEMERRRRRRRRRCPIRS